MAASRAVTVEIRDAHINYRAYEESVSGLKSGFARGRIGRRYRTIEAIRGVTLDLHEQETLGIIGANGSGKSTLLAAMTGLLPLASGSIRGRSRPSLLGVSSVLRPTLSGRRNILIGGLALGFTKAEITARMDEIIDFTGLQEAIDLPMRTYSTGMRARLHFAIATARIPAILLIDEVLTVGDEHFRRLAEQRINEVRSAAGSVALVTHNMNEVKRFCDRAVWLEKGRIRNCGSADQVAAAYLASTAAQAGSR